MNAVLNNSFRKILHDVGGVKAFRVCFSIVKYCHCLVEEKILWANAKCDGRPAEYWWRPLFNAAKFG